MDDYVAEREKNGRTDGERQQPLRQYSKASWDGLLSG